jgi:hypothetical protein
LALLALAIQLVVSFAHVHLDHVASGPVSTLALAGVHAPIGAQAASVPATDQAPARTDDYCAVCALIHLAGTVVAAEPPTLRLPAVFTRTRSEVAVEFRSTAERHSLFAARAPPIA